MATLNRVLDAIETHIGFPRSRTNGISRRLQEAGQLPVGAPGVAPEMNERDACLLLSTLMSAPKLHEAVDHAQAYAEMTPGGAVLSADAPDSIPRSSLEYLVTKAWVVISGDPDAVDDVRGHRFEFVHGWRELSAHTPEGTVTRFVLPGQLASHQQAPHRIAGLVKGEAFVNLMKDLF
ncbi:hypothetical protein ABIF65_002796 [Bradyrhizobium japonicum]|jgi:hypothetical protein|uniref:hypothetical protein n=1 Tax=Bradyrhizobium TaxID=374 RepID=UPI0004254753|nr:MULTISPECIES: hypothetical protein [Bradyrhizobium]MBR0882712.1 hypothetical protein [Bradyrhizobium liaoningense]MBR0948042.1 hypothetical protein [Bradyrhizobium liaoningense]MBR1002601.1 hypothetical protein [Bradyrhizobium liaoningense]MBR1033723.1 hypothetical protein [Bradyrhizobium liaoningense]MBR1069020.1 hypothetical protein [Bradyrhizobium liaoningense]